MPFKSSLVTYLFGFMEHLALHTMVEGVVAAAPIAAAGATSLSDANSWVYPLALLAAPLVRLAEDCALSSALLRRVEVPLAPG
jgi:hypothetical protein